MLFLMLKCFRTRHLNQMMKYPMNQMAICQLPFCKKLRDGLEKYLDAVDRICGLPIEMI